MKKLFITFILFLVFCFQCFASSASKSCTAKIDICDSLNNNQCRKESVYIYTYLSANIANGELISETHTFNFNNLLGNSSKFEFKKLSEKHLVFEGEKFFLGVPFEKSNPLLYLQKSSIPEISALNGWKTLCE